MAVQPRPIREEFRLANFHPRHDDATHLATSPVSRILACRNVIMSCAACRSEFFIV